MSFLQYLQGYNHRLGFTVITTVTALLVLILCGIEEETLGRSEFRYHTNRVMGVSTVIPNQSSSEYVGNYTASFVNQPIRMQEAEHVNHSTPERSSAQENHRIESLLSPMSVTLNETVDWEEIDFTEEYGCDSECQRRVQEIRRRILSDACAIKRETLTSVWDSEGHLRADQMQRLNHLYPLEESKTIYCSVPKSGCSAWKRILLVAVGYKRERLPQKNIHPMFDAKIKGLNRYSVEEAEQRLKTYNKFIFVRDPMRRMLSLFLDKAVNKHQFSFNKSQFNEFLEHISKKRIDKGPIVSFGEHWAHISHLCLPCDVNYTFIGRLETSRRDTHFVFQNYFPDKNLTMVVKTGHETHSSNGTLSGNYFDQVGQTVLENIYDRYRLDYDFFGYKRPWMLEDTDS